METKAMMENSELHPRLEAVVGFAAEPFNYYVYARAVDGSIWRYDLKRDVWELKPERVTDVEEADDRNV